VNDHGYIVGFTEALGEGLPILWTPPNNVPSIPWRGASTRSHPHINNSGDVALVGQVLRQDFTVVEGVLFSKQLDMFQCDGLPVLHP
jgi:hypothetical protein